MFLQLRKAAEKIKESRNKAVEIISHMDADGVCAAAIISKTLERENIEHSVRFVKMLYKEVVEEISPAEFTIFTDLGSSQLSNLSPWKGREVIICDHHIPQEGGWEGLLHLNAHFFGINGTEEISGAGMAYLLARMFKNYDLSRLAILGALGDAQNVWGRLKGYNRRILEEAKMQGLEVGEDLLLFGRFSRPLFKSLMSFSDPFIPGLSGSVVGAVSLLKELGIPQRNEKGEWRKVADLSPEEKRKLADALIERSQRYVPPELSSFVPGLVWGEVYTLLAETEEVLRDASEFSTCLNSTARHEQPEIGFEIAKGDRGPYYRTMLQLLREYRKFISQALEVLQREGVKSGPRGRIQYFDLTGVIKETFVGTLAGMCLSSGLCDPYKPVVGVVRDAGLARISVRCSKLLFLRGVNLAESVRKAAETVGGEGGGHAVACGAQVPEEKLNYFLQELETHLEREGKVFV